ncbi:MAG: type I phosphomannose isomerase catalytic subunit [Bacteroidota bacterium]|nr:type I phosphomannose isomerase catalytic subunit [Bacteroidota bacterium]
MLYPLKFIPQYKYRLWGGNKLSNILHKHEVPEKTGESWELSGIADSLSIVANGFLSGNNIQELAEIYMGDLMGDSVYEKFGKEFPLLIKLIDANEVLSIQVHPNDELAAKRHNAYGKTEMWYVIQADEGSEIFTGFNRDMNKEALLDHMDANTLETVLNRESAQAGDCFFIPAGRIHATGAGILFAEIQQTSDITYRIFDWNRMDKDGEPRDLHTDLAIEAIDYKYHSDYRTTYLKEQNQSKLMVDCRYFTSNYFSVNQMIEKDYSNLDSFIIYICLNGACKIEYNENEIVDCKMGETVLIPASLKNFRIIPLEATELLEVYIKSMPSE